MVVEEGAEAAEDLVQGVAGGRVAQVALEEGVVGGRVAQVALEEGVAGGRVAQVALEEHDVEDNDGVEEVEGAALQAGVGVDAVAVDVDLHLVEIQPNISVEIAGWTPASRENVFSWACSSEEGEQYLRCTRMPIARDRCMTDVQAIARRASCDRKWQRPMSTG